MSANPTFFTTQINHNTTFGTLYDQAQDLLTKITTYSTTNHVEDNLSAVLKNRLTTFNDEYNTAKHIDQEQIQKQLARFLETLLICLKEHTNQGIAKHKVREYLGGSFINPTYYHPIGKQEPTIRTTTDKVGMGISASVFAALAVTSVGLAIPALWVPALVVGCLAAAALIVTIALSLPKPPSSKRSKTADKFVFQNAFNLSHPKEKLQLVDPKGEDTVKNAAKKFQ